MEAGERETATYDYMGESERKKGYREALRSAWLNLERIIQSIQNDGETMEEALADARHDIGEHDREGNPDLLEVKE